MGCPRSYGAVGFALLFISGCARQATACSCVASAGDDRGPYVFARNDVVFRGKLVNVEYLDRKEDRPLRRFVAKFEVSRVWRGAVGKILTMHTREAGTDCIGFPTDVGPEWIVFAQRVRAYDKFLPDAKGGQFLWHGWLDLLPPTKEIIEPSACSSSSPVEDIKTRLLARLGNGRPPARD